MAKKLENIVKSTWKPIYDAIVNSRKRISAIKKEYGLKNGLLCEYCMKTTGYNPEELRIFKNIGTITDKLISGKSIASVKKYYNVGATAFTKIFKEIYGMPATQYLIDYRARQTEGCKLVPKSDTHASKKNRDSKLERYKFIAGDSKPLIDGDC